MAIGANRYSDICQFVYIGEAESRQYRGERSEPASRRNRETLCPPPTAHRAREGGAAGGDAAGCRKSKKTHGMAVSLSRIGRTNRSAEMFFSYSMIGGSDSETELVSFRQRKVAKCKTVSKKHLRTRWCVVAMRTPFYAVRACSFIV